jgi:alpha-tubulin suppressor-like RCC1 family protein
MKRGSLWLPFAIGGTIALLATLKAGGGDNSESTTPSNAEANRPPAAVDDAAITFTGQPANIPVLANDYDADGDSLAIVAVTPGAHGTVTINDRSFSIRYVPSPNFSGQDSFGYSISDGHGGTSSATVHVTINPPGAPYAWGSGSNGDLGNGSTKAECWPVPVHNLSNVVAVTAGGSHSLALKSDGTVWAWGKGSSGELGTGVPIDSRAPVQSYGLADIVGIAAGETHSLAVRSDGSVWAWGSNHYGELGDGTTNQSSIPITVPGLTNAWAIACGASHCLALKSDGTVWAWGYNYYGRLGNGTNLDSNVPVQVSDLTNAVAVAADSANSLALKADGTVWAWGSGRYGALGNGSTSHHSSPVQVLALSNIVTVSAGGGHGLALKSDGTVWAWGRGDYGQLGNGATTNSSTAVAVLNLSNVVAIAGGQSHSLAVQADGMAWAWGSGSSGVLGNNAYEDTSLPVQVCEEGPWAAIGSQSTHSLAVRLTRPWIYAPPTDLSAELNNTANLSVVARGATPMYYQWQYYGTDLIDGGRISGAREATLRIAEAQYGDEGDYRVVVCNGYGCATSQVAVLTVTRIMPALSWPRPADMTYGSPLSAVQLNAAVTIPGTCVYVPAVGTLLGAGTNMLTVCFTPTVTNLYREVTVTNWIVVRKAALAVTVNSCTRPYNTPNPEFAFAIAGFVNGESERVLSRLPTVDTAATLTSPVGIYPISAGGAEAANYEFTYADSSLTITLATPIVAWPSSASVTYGTALGLIETNASANVPGIFDYLPADTRTLGAGPHTLAVRFLPSDAQNYAAATGSMDLVINPAPLAIKAEDKTRAYNEANPLLTMSYRGFVNGETEAVLTQPAVMETTAMGTSPVGQYPIFAKGATAPNYAIEYEPGILSVLPASVGLVWDTPKDIGYGTRLSTNQLNATAKVAGNFDYEPPLDALLNAGTNTLTVAFVPSDALNYAAATSSVPVVVTKARLTIKPDDATRAYNQPNPPFTGQYSGFVEGETEGVLENLVRFETLAEAKSPVGHYPITASGGSAANYDLICVAGTLSITQAQPVVRWQSPTPIAWGTPLGSTQLNASADVAGSFEYSPAAGAILDVGTNLLSAVFLPSDLVNYAAATGTVELVIIRVNHAPLAMDDRVETFMGQSADIAVLANDLDEDSDILTIVAFADGQHGGVTRQGSVLTYRPDTGYLGPDSFSYTISDGRGETATGEVAVQILPPIAIQQTDWLWDAAGTIPRFALHIQTLSGRRYVLEFSDSLTYPQWQPLVERVGDGTVITMTDDNAVTTQRFYRIGVLPEAVAGKP